MVEVRKNSKKFAQIGTVIDKILQQHRPLNDQSLIEVWKVWEKAVGFPIAANARPVAFKGDLLLVHVSSSTWLHQLRFLEKEMIVKVNAALGGNQVRSMKLKVGEF